MDRRRIADQTAVVGAQTPTAPNCPKDKVLNGNTAAACLNNWRRKAEAAMYQKCKDDYPKNSAFATPTRGGTATSPPTRATHSAALQADVAKAEAKHGASSDHAETARALLTEYNQNCCRADMGQRMIQRQQRRTGHAA